MIDPHDMTSEKSEKVVRAALHTLAEHFEACQILVSGPSPAGGTFHIFSGEGNWFARQGMAREFMQVDQAQVNANLISQKMQPPPDDGESWKS